MSRARAIAAILAAIALYAAVSLWPYEWVTGWIVNGADPLPAGGVRFETPGIAIAKVAPAWLQTAMRSHQLEISLRARSLVSEQFGPARIFTLSLDPYERNLMIGQEGADLLLRLRTSWTDANGTIDDWPIARVPRVFLKGDWVDLYVRIEPGSLRIAVGDELVVDEPLPRRPFEPWDPSYQLALGNELTGNRPWLGEISQARVSAGDRTEDYAETSRLKIPAIGIFGRREGNPKLVPLRNLKSHDAVANVVLYIPLGFLLGLLLGTWSARPRWHVTFSAVLFIAAVSASMEVLQVFVPRRAPSVDDVIFNTLGGGLGLLLALWARQRLRAVLLR